MKVAIFGTGSVGGRLAELFRKAGVDVLPCHLQPQTGQFSFGQGAAEADAVVLALPWTALATVLPPLADALRNKIVIDCTNPLNADWSPVLLGQENSAGEETARLLPGARVVKAFNTIFADVMTADRQVRDGQRITAFVAADDAAAKTAVLELAQRSGFATQDAGPLRSARYLESMAHLNIQIAVGLGGGTNAAFVYHQVK